MAGFDAGKRKAGPPRLSWDMWLVAVILTLAAACMGAVLWDYACGPEDKRSRSWRIHPD